MALTEVKKVMAAVIEGLEVMEEGCIGFGDDNVAHVAVQI
jgi:hypothetical protein